MVVLGKWPPKEVAVKCRFYRIGEDDYIAQLCGCFWEVAVQKSYRKVEV